MKAGPLLWMMEHSFEPRPLIGIEHPYTIDSLENGVRSLGGAQQMLKIVSGETKNQPANLYLNQNAPLGAPISSANLKTEDLLLAIQVPRMMSRKRKRPGTRHGTVTDERISRSRKISIEDMTCEKRLLQSLHDHQTTYDVQVVGKVEQTHRFRDMPDLSFATLAGKFVKRFQEKVVPFDYAQIEESQLEPNDNNQAFTEILPPPRMSHFDIPFNYLYRQNPSMRKAVNQAGEITLVNEFAARKVHTPRLAFDAEEIPCEPPKDAPPLESLDPIAQELVAVLRDLFDKRPAWTRRALQNQLDQEKVANVFRYCAQYVAYMFRSGPWRDSLIKLGVDPRRDPRFRMYQTMFFQFEIGDKPAPSSVGGDGGSRLLRGGPRTRGRGRHSAYYKPQLGDTSHIFDGVKVGFDGRVWQVCDITDPLIQSILRTATIRQRCHIRTDGWFHNGTWAKARTITRAKMRVIAGVEDVHPSHLERVAMVPDHVADRARSSGLVLRGDSQQFIQMAEQLRNMLSSPERALSQSDKTNPDHNWEREKQRYDETTSAFRHVEGTTAEGRANQDHNDDRDEETKYDDAVDDDEEDDDDVDSEYPAGSQWF